MFKVIDMDSRSSHDIVYFLTTNEAEPVFEVPIGQMSGPGVWRRVLTYLEMHDIEDLDHVMPAWRYDLIGEWKY